MKLYEFVKITEEDYDTYDTVYDAEVTVCYIEEDNDNDNDNYDKFCIELMKKVDMKKQNGDILIVDWTGVIKSNMEKFKAFTKKYWYENCQYEDDEDEFIYQWINEIHQYMSGNVAEYLYKDLVKLVKDLKA